MFIFTRYVSNGRSRAPSLKQEDRVTSLCQPPGQGGASRARADNDVVMVRGRGRGEDRGQPGEAELSQVRQPEDERERGQCHQQQGVGQVNHVTVHWAWSLRQRMDIHL